MMRLLAFTLTLAMLFSVAAKAQDRSIEDVINLQIEAFETDDIATAFTFASPNIQAIFGTAEQFADMVQVDGQWRINGVYRVDAPGLNA
ncbi:hypothetical protein GCM10016455_17070 [Aliiroseovarius zhejiangensis]|uniref:DUF4864 domain-containing protein n=1 Tax=Aliiroseovarius zhejiangensis TaxID=1632025 RepID=A0ABQ3IXU3_9RHOB|nr:DUF4864 domain-containing protein [Aliiroseovarius zhejiangensis]GHE97198.1 hypothetical protein GCM10016455_17070 [Aliiroseovarius zhejiangensis]